MRTDSRTVRFTDSDKTEHGTLCTWWQFAPKVDALSIPDQFRGGCGDRKRRSPTGGAAYGIPLQDIKFATTTTTIRTVAKSFARFA